MTPSEAGRRPRRRPTEHRCSVGCPGQARVLVLTIPLRRGTRAADGTRIAGMLAGLIADFFATIGAALPVDLSQCAAAIEPDDGRPGPIVDVRVVH